jgi:predicted porin
MKKLLATMLLSLGVSGMAMAQSSVTIYGLLDVGFVGANQALRSTDGGAVTKSNSNQFGQGSESGNRLGFRGTEDLGGGTSAFFTVETQLFPQDQNLSGSSNNGLTNRQSFVGLAQKGLGQFALGRQYSPIYNLGVATNPSGYAAMPGDMFFVAGSAGGAGTSTATFVTGNENSAAFTNRVNNALTFRTDRRAGVSVQGIYSLRSSNTNQTSATAGGNTNTTGYGLGADYIRGKLLLSAAYQTFLQETTGAGVATAITDINQGIIVNARDTQTYAGATYDFGILKAYAQYINRKITSAVDSNEFAQRSAQQIGVRGFVSPKVEGWASVGNGRFDQYGSSTPTVNFVGYQLGSNYWFSKRTNAYAIYGNTNSTSSSGANAAGSGSYRNAYALGVRHTF